MQSTMRHTFTSPFFTSIRHINISRSNQPLKPQKQPPVPGAPGPKYNPIYPSADSDNYVDSAMKYYEQHKKEGLERMKKSTYPLQLAPQKNSKVITGTKIVRPGGKIIGQVIHNDKKKHSFTYRKSWIGHTRLPNDDPNDKSYQIIGAAVIERFGKVEPTPPLWYTEYQNYKDSRQPFKKPHQVIPDELLPPVVPGRSEALFEASLQPIVTPADQANDVHSLERALQESLYLIVKRKNSPFEWEFPQLAYTDDDSEHVKKTVQRTLNTLFDSDFRTHVVGNAPLGVQKHVYTNEYLQQNKTSFKGEKIFFYHSVYVEGRLKLSSPDILDYAWVRKSDFSNYFNKQQIEVVNEFLMQSEFHKVGSIEGKEN